MPLEFHDHPSFLPRACGHLPVVPAAMHESSSSSLNFAAEHRADPDHSFHPPGYFLFQPIVTSFHSTGNCHFRSRCEYQFEGTT